MESIIVFSHLRWDFVFQRPQHLMSRLARHYAIVFVEEPQPGGRDLAWRQISPHSRLTVLRPEMNIEKPGFHRVDLAPLRDKLHELRAQYPSPIAWVYTPMAMPLLDAITPRAIVYDCMDELSAFKDPPPELGLREEALLATADLVFTGGPSLYEARRHRHPNVHCFPSSVDVSHFRQALNRNIAHPALLELQGPKLGFFGVLDERIDLELIAAIADQRPHWQLILVGPIAKIDADQLPRRVNIHYLGQQSYQKLPQFLAAWDVCLMPFAMNESTRYISPTKSLEYMAAELPVVSTPVPDVQALHGDVIDIAGTTGEFIACCERALFMSDVARQVRIRRMREKLSRTSWDHTAATMRDLLCGLQSLPVSDPACAGQPSAR